MAEGWAGPSWEGQDAASTGPQMAGPEQWQNFQTQVLARVQAALLGFPVRGDMGFVSSRGR